MTFVPGAFMALFVGFPVLAAPTPEDPAKAPAVVAVSGKLGPGSPYWAVQIEFKGDPANLKEIQVRMATGETAPTAEEKDAKTVVWRFAAPFEVKKDPKPVPDAPAVTSAVKAGNRVIGVQKYGLKAGEKYAFRVCAVDAKGNVYSLHTFAGTAIDD